MSPEEFECVVHMENIMCRTRSSLDTDRYIKKHIPHFVEIVTRDNKYFAEFDNLRQLIEIPYEDLDDFDDLLNWLITVHALRNVP